MENENNTQTESDCTRGRVRGGRRPRGRGGTNQLTEDEDEQREVQDEKG